jgi:hypothetical protein
MDKYRSYFDIDPDYFPAVNADVIKKNPDLWKKFYPHETFIKLIKDVVNVLTRKQPLNIWVEGAYGTGKSHAVLTLKRLLDANEADTRSYFEEFNIDTDLCNKFVGAKNSGKIVTVHRYGSSSIHNDNDLIIAIQESVEAALAEAGIENVASDALKKAIIRYLSNEENKKMFEVFVKGSYAELFGGDSVDDIIRNLESYKDQPLQALMEKIFKLANEKQIKAFTLDDKGLIAWIKEVIERNNLAALVFIWDEFTEYIINNMNNLTGFQSLIELSETTPFCFVAVTHKSHELFADTDKRKNKILGRFVRPTCNIELPENMAFKLIGAALKKKDDENILNEWKEIINDLSYRTVDSRKQVQEVAKISDDELADILPIHPYAASLLKHISTSFESNQRSMFDFIKNDRGDDIKGFQWFIDNVGPENDNPLLTIDMLWGFFYDIGKESLSHSVRMILDYYPRLTASKQLNSNEQRILKTILLFQAISMETNNSVSLFYANEKNLNNAFEGSDLENGEAGRCAEKLCRDNIIYKKKLKGDNFVYAILTGEIDSNKVDENKKQFESKTTSSLVSDGELDECLELTPALKLRYEIDFAGSTDLDVKGKKAISNAMNNTGKLYAVMTFAKNNGEAAVINKKIHELLAECATTKVIFIDSSKTVLGDEQFKEWVEHKATSLYYIGKDKDQGAQYENYAKDVLRVWKNRIRNGQFVVYTTALPNGDIKANMNALIDSLFDEDVKQFQLCLEKYNVHDNLWNASQLKIGVECGVNQKTSSTYSNKMKLENALDGAWGVSEYWKKNPSLQISRIKNDLENLIQKQMNAEGRIAISQIYNTLKGVPYGFMPCNLTAFIMGFLLKEYVSEIYSWSDGMSRDELNLAKFKDMVDEVIKQDITPNSRYRDKYIVMMTPEEKCFVEATATAFKIPKESCTSLEQTRERIRAKMKEFGFPIWTLINILDKKELQSDYDSVREVIDLYCGIANNSANSGKTESEIAMSIGQICLGDSKIVEDLTMLLNRNNCTEGMTNYLSDYREGMLVHLAEEIGDNGQFINAVRSKFDADAASWVWKQDVVNTVIDNVICEYQIVTETGNLFSKCKSYDEALRMWSEKCNNLKLSYEVIKNEVGSVNVLLAKLYQLRSTGKIQDSQKEEFLSNIKDYGNNFKDLYAGQFLIFVKVENFYLQDLNDSDKEQIFRKIPTGVFALDRSSYNLKLEQIVDDYKKQMGSLKLKTLWKEKTGTDSPYDWSDKYRMPIWIMLPEKDHADCRKSFGTILNKNADSEAIKSAQIFLENATFWDDLNDPSKRDAAFRKYIIEDNYVMLKDIDMVKNYLSEHLTDRPYNWSTSTSLRIRLNELAQNRYDKGGYNEAFDKIDQMSPERAKEYLKSLIKNNMKVGIEIIKDK